MEERVILVDELDNEIGFAGKLEAHEKGMLHRAFSVFVFNHTNELLLQQRALNKYHSPGLWTNTCCSHPRENEPVLTAAERRLSEEMGMSCELKPAFSFLYRAEVDQGLIEHEFDHVFIGRSEVEPIINHEEVAAYKYQRVEEIDLELKRYPEKFTTWFRICWPTVLETLHKKEII